MLLFILFYYWLFLIINLLLWIREDYKDIGTQLYHVSLFDMFVN